MSDEHLKQLIITRCKMILHIGAVKIYRFGDAYTVKDKISGDTIFEIKAAEYCNPQNQQTESCECLIVDKHKILLSGNDDNLLTMVKEMYDTQSQNDTTMEPNAITRPGILDFLDKYIRR